jgi:hypothetical protein
MPNRVLRDWTDSKRMSKLSAQAERFFTRLFMKADDYGRYHADAKLLKAALLPHLIDEVTIDDITAWLKECVDAGLVITYTIDDDSFLEIQDFEQKLRIKKPKFPEPLHAKTAHVVHVQDTCSTDAVQMYDTCTTDVPLKGREEKRKEKKPKKKRSLLA